MYEGIAKKDEDEEGDGGGGGGGRGLRPARSAGEFGPFSPHTTINHDSPSTTHTLWSPAIKW